MTHALSNPYEITVDGITCKCSPYNAGWYISANDFYKLGDRAEAFEKSLFLYYAAEKLWSGQGPKKELEGIKVYYLKPTSSVKAHADDFLITQHKDKGEVNAAQEIKIPEGVQGKH